MLLKKTFNKKGVVLICFQNIRQIMKFVQIMEFTGSTEEAIKDSGLDEESLSSERTGLIMGSGGASSEDQIDSADILRSKGLKRIGPYRVTKAMGSTVSACLSTSFGIK